MKKAFATLLFLFCGIFLFAQQKDDSKEKKENMGQSIKEVNMYYRDKMKEIKADTGLSKEQKKERKKALKEMKRKRIHEINQSGKKSNNSEREKNAEKLKEEKNDIKEKKEKKVKG